MVLKAFYKTITWLIPLFIVSCNQPKTESPKLTRSVISISEDWRLAIVWSSVSEMGGITLKLDVHEIESVIPFQTKYFASLPSNIEPQFVGDKYLIVYRDDSQSVWISDAHNLTRRDLLFSCLDIELYCPSRANFDVNLRDSLIFLEDSLGVMLSKFDSIGQVTQVREFGTVYRYFFTHDLNRCLLVYDSDQKKKAVVEFDIVKETSTELFEFDGFMMFLDSKGGDNPVYFTKLAHDGSQNLWKFDRVNSRLEQLTSLSYPRVISNFHLHGDSILYEIHDNSPNADYSVKRLLNISNDTSVESKK